MFRYPSVCLNDLVVCLGLCLSVNRFKLILHVRVCICYCVFDWISEFLTNGFFQAKLYSLSSIHKKIISREWNTTVVCFQHLLQPKYKLFQDFIIQKALDKI